MYYLYPESTGIATGLAICTFSEKARERAQQVPYGLLSGSLQLYKYIMEKDYRYPSTPPYLTCLPWITSWTGF